MALRQRAKPATEFTDKTLSVAKPPRNVSWPEVVRSAAIEVWGNEVEATEWLQRPQAQLGGATPESLLSTPEGGYRVAALLSALDNGFPV